ncbi:DNA ligase-1 [Enterovibrio nigricans DSM 22720]|uniref:DNA ligase-1 n=1 Tax=Enterovibrio nigricans DSM 22720 TaxID=1121868 RepID=A0A1T4V2I2_9GAMM|nr:DNA ligase [Enterovibrio nigricans]SKA59165.1 DNA ligase-1 [Enterovibrio nigricans DSM 22720]
MYSTILTATVALTLSNTTSALTLNNQVFEPQLAKNYEHGVYENWSSYLYSEKLDGIRAIWDGEKLMTRAGNKIAAPVWFTKSLPDTVLEGELWAGRGKFEHTLSVVMDDQPDENAWQAIQFMVFELPLHKGDFETRYQSIVDVVNRIDKTHLRYVPHFPAVSELHINGMLIEIDKYGGEGLMLRHRDKVYVQGRSDAMVKLKIAQDAEAEVIGYVAGKGKHEGRMGALIVKLLDGTTFKIGSGFSDMERDNPPALGTLVTYRYNGFTKNGIPKFARFVRVDITKQQNPL